VKLLTNGFIVVVTGAASPSTATWPHLRFDVVLEEGEY